MRVSITRIVTLLLLLLAIAASIMNVLIKWASRGAGQGQKLTQIDCRICVCIYKYMEADLAAAKSRMNLTWPAEKGTHSGRSKNGKWTRLVLNYDCLFAEYIYVCVDCA